MDSNPDSSNQDPEYLDAIHQYETALDHGETQNVEEWVRKQPLRLRNQLRDYARRRGTLAGITADRPQPEFVSLADFSHYEIGRVFDWGGTASIYMAEDRRFGRTV